MARIPRVEYTTYNEANGEMNYFIVYNYFYDALLFVMDEASSAEAKKLYDYSNSIYEYQFNNGLATTSEEYELVLHNRTKYKEIADYLEHTTLPYLLSLKYDKEMIAKSDLTAHNANVKSLRETQEKYWLNDIYLYLLDDYQKKPDMDASNLAVVADQFVGLFRFACENDTKIGFYRKQKLSYVLTITPGYYPSLKDLVEKKKVPAFLHWFKNV